VANLPGVVNNPLASATISPQIQEIEIATNQQMTSQLNLLKNQAIKIARFVFFFGIVLAVFSLLLMLNTLENFRPLWSTACFYFVDGVLVPLIIILRSPKIKEFTMQLLKKITERCGIM
jgi:hypothetical protein